MKTHSQMESHKKASAAWEEKFHKLAIEKDKLTKQTIDYEQIIEDHKDKLVMAEQAQTELAANLRTMHAETEAELLESE